jgi:hypothetical protein
MSAALTLPKKCWYPQASRGSEKALHPVMRSQSDCVRVVILIIKWMSTQGDRPAFMLPSRKEFSNDRIHFSRHQFRGEPYTSGQPRFSTKENDQLRRFGAVARRLRKREEPLSPGVWLSQAFRSALQSNWRSFSRWGVENPDARTHGAQRPAWTKTLLAIR